MKSYTYASLCLFHYQDRLCARQHLCLGLCVTIKSANKSKCCFRKVSWFMPKSSDMYPPHALSSAIRKKSPFRTAFAKRASCVMKTPTGATEVVTHLRPHENWCDPSVQTKHNRATTRCFPLFFIYTWCYTLSILSTWGSGIRIFDKSKIEIDPIYIYILQFVRLWVPEKCEASSNTLTVFPYLLSR